MSGPGATPLFIDTSAFFAYYNDNDAHYERARTLFGAIRDAELVYRPLYTSRDVLGELTAGLLAKVDHATASRALRDIRTAMSFRVLRIEDSHFEAACEAFHRYDDHRISLVDHTSAVLAAEHDVERIFTFDPGDFRVLGLTVVPGDTGEA